MLSRRLRGMGRHALNILYEIGTLDKRLLFLLGLVGHAYRRRDAPPNIWYDLKMVCTARPTIYVFEIVASRQIGTRNDRQWHYWAGK